MKSEAFDGILTGSELRQAVPFTKFDAKLSIEYDAEASKLLDKDYWRVVTPFKYYVGAEADQKWVYVPAGFLTDGASVPWPLWSILPPWGPYGQAAVVHDILCETMTYYVDGVEVPIHSRKTADDIFLEAMAVAGVSKWKRWTLYAGVRAYALAKNLLPFLKNKRLARKQMLQEDWIAVHTAAGGGGGSETLGVATQAA